MCGSGRTDTGLFDHGTPCGGDTAAEEADLFERSLLVHCNDGNVGHYCVLGESGGAHLRQDQSLEATATNGSDERNGEHPVLCSGIGLC